MNYLDNQKIVYTEEDRGKFGWATFMVAALLVGIGLASIYSATYNSGLSVFFNRQVIYSVIGFIVLFAVMYIPEDYLHRYTSTAYSAGIFLLLVVLIPGVGTKVYGTSGWLNIGGFSIQPSEFAKITTLMMIARHLSFKGKDIRSYRDFGIVMAYVGLPIFLVYLEPDFGSSIVFIAMLLGILLWTGFDLFLLYFIVSLPVIFILSLIGDSYFFVTSIILSSLAVAFRKKIVITVAVIGIIVGVGYASSIIVNNLAPHQQRRIETLLDPEKDPRGSGYNVIQSVKAVGNGGITGQGYLRGLLTQYQYIPKQWTDFIYSVPAEEFGFVGAVSVLGLLSLLVFRAIYIASRVESKYFSIIAIGAASLFFYHSMINIGMVIGVMPVMGIPLPFLSAGGSSMIANMALVGLLLNAFRSNVKQIY